jgi:hypothetical protein
MPPARRPAPGTLGGGNARAHPEDLPGDPVQCLGLGSATYQHDALGRAGCSFEGIDGVLQGAEQAFDDGTQQVLSVRRRGQSVQDAGGLRAWACAPRPDTAA